MKTLTLSQRLHGLKAFGNFVHHLRAGRWPEIKRAWLLTDKNQGLGRCDISMLCVDADAKIMTGNYVAVASIADILISRYDAAEGYYYQAFLAHLYGRFDEAQERLEQVFKRCPDHADSVYILADLSRYTGDKTRAWTALEVVAKVHKRLKTWLVMANMVETAADLERLKNNWLALLEKRRNDRTLLDYMVLAALRIRDYTAAKTFAGLGVNQAVKSACPTIKFKPKKIAYTSGGAEEALLDLVNALEKAGIEMFLVSGTLLGCVREKKLLSHDKDIDVGIWEDVDRDRLYAALWASGHFTILHSRAKATVRIKHINGIGIDVFYHYKTPESYWHAGVKMRWNNKPFSLVPHRFLGHEFLIPADTELYLTENYGDWKTPQIDFDSTFDTPNGEVLEAEEMVIHCYKMLAETVASGNKQKQARYLTEMARYGDAVFADEFRKKHL